MGRFLLLLVFPFPLAVRFAGVFAFAIPVGSAGEALGFLVNLSLAGDFLVRAMLLEWIFSTSLEPDDPFSQPRDL